MIGGRVALAVLATLALSLALPAELRAESAPVGAEPAAGAKAVGGAGAASAGADEGAAAPTFDVMEYRVEGNTVLSTVEIEEAVYPYLGYGRTQEDVEAARNVLQQAYSRRGYETVTAEVPQQDVSSGVVRIVVTERRVGRLRVKGSRYFSLTAIKEGLPSFGEGTVPNFNDAERDLVNLSLIPNRRVTPVLKAGAAPNTVDVDLNVEDELPLHGSVEINNRKSADTEPLRVLASLRYENLWQRGDAASFSYQVAPQRPSDAEVYSGSYLLRVPDSRLSLLAYGLRSNSDVSTVGDTSVIGNGSVIGLRALLPITIRPGFVQSISVGGDYKSFNEDTQFADDTSSAPITYYPVTLGYLANWSDETSETDFGSNLVFTFRGLGSSQNEFDNKRFNADASFIILQGDASRLQKLPEDVQLYGRVTGQATGEPLVSNEEFALGGVDTVRGYLEAEALGDFGIALQTEVRSPSLALLIDPAVDDLRAFGFFDYGAASIWQPLPGQDSEYELASIGFGARIMVLEHIGGSIDLAVPLMDGPETDRGHLRTNFRAFGEF